MLTGRVISTLFKGVHYEMMGRGGGLPVEGAFYHHAA